MRREPKMTVNLTRGTVTCRETVIANTALRRMRGLLGRQSLPGGEGMLLQPAPSIHTAFMRFPIDVVMLDRNLEVVKIVERMRPWRTASARRARSVLELAEGEVSRSGVELGDQLAFIDPGVDLSDTIRLSVGSVPQNGRPPSSAAESMPSDLPAEGARDDARADILLVSSDRRFRAVTELLLTQHGWSVALSDQMGHVASAAERVGAGVVLLDAGASLTAAAREAAQIERLDAKIAVLLFAEQPEEQLSTMPVLSKWDSFERLYTAVAQACPPGGVR
jgi:uncharacterized membrane protein (UPF0127 family)